MDPRTGPVIDQIYALLEIEFAGEQNLVNYYLLEIHSLSISRKHNWTDFALLKNKGKLIED